jgi:hypothetical protein
MAHTCGLCGQCGREIVAPTPDGRFEFVKPSFNWNRNYSHDGASWKRSTKARKQYLRHVRR